ncbi:hypothetical protein D3C78_424960 [compost metagenome]
MEATLTGLDSMLPGPMMLQPPACTSMARRASVSRLKPNSARASSMSVVPPTSRSTALVICTQVVASMPPKTT